MKCESSNQFSSDYDKLLREDKKIASKVLELMLEADKYRSNPLEGKGKPEPLKGNLKGHFSRRITDKHRLIYRYDQDMVVFVSCYGHYDD